MVTLAAIAVAQELGITFTLDTGGLPRIEMEFIKGDVLKGTQGVGKPAGQQ